MNEAGREPECLLFERLPSLRARLPRVRLADGAPTPCRRLERLGAAWGGAEVWIKRDDVSSRLYGGNKVRKLEWLLAEARARGARGVVTFGAWGSHHALATAVFARELDLVAYLVLCPQPLTDHVHEHLLADLGVGARIVPIGHFALMPWGYAVARRRARLEGLGPLYRIPPGGSSVTGTLGYVEAGLEIAREVARGRLPAPRRVYAAAGTLGTVVGLSVGLGLGVRWAPALEGVEVVGVRVVPRPVTSGRRMRRLQHRLLERFERLGVERSELGLPCRVRLLGDQLGDGYGHATEAGTLAARQARECEGIELDTTYTAKCMAGVASEAQGAKGPLLYVHTLNSAPIAPWAEQGARMSAPAALERALAKATRRPESVIESC